MNTRFSIRYPLNARKRENDMAECAILRNVFDSNAIGAVQAQIRSGGEAVKAKDAFLGINKTENPWKKYFLAGKTIYHSVLSVGLAQYSKISMEAAEEAYGQMKLKGCESKPKAYSTVECYDGDSCKHNIDDWRETVNIRHSGAWYIEAAGMYETP